MTKSYDALLDTGFDSVMSVDRRDAGELGLRYIGDKVEILADGSEHSSQVFAGRVLFAGEWRDVPITASGVGASVGMQLIYGARLTLDVFLDGDVDLEFVGDRRLAWDLS